MYGRHGRGAVISGLFKVEGSGNDFVLAVGEWADRLGTDRSVVLRLCDRRRGIGADGALAVHVEDHRRVRLDYWNADGGAAKFCANGTRCAARAAVELLDCAPSLTVVTDWAEISACVEGARVSLELPPPEGPAARFDVAADSGAVGVWLVHLGVPHLVAEAEGPLSSLDLASVAPPLRRHRSLGPDGANVNFFELTTAGEVAVRSWERGVEGETQSCGSGMVSVALVVMERQASREVLVVPASGDRLTVSARGRPPSCGTVLTGPTRFVAEVVPSPDLLSGM
jgi:diaminopimelate epimerase